MNLNVRRLLTTPALAGALISAAVLGTPGAVSADEWGHWDGAWSDKGGAEVDCSFSAWASVKADDIKGEYSTDQLDVIDDIEDQGNQCGNDVKQINTIDIYQWGEYAQANAFNAALSIVQYGNATDDGDVDNQANDNDVKVKEFVMANVNINYNKIKDLDQDLVDIDVND